MSDLKTNSMENWEEILREERDRETEALIQFIKKLQLHQ